jgi:hypothetical protein
VSEARTMFLGVDLLFHLAAVVLPFAVCIAFVLLAMRRGKAHGRVS